VADNLTPEQRRKTMQAVKGKNTSLEKMVAAAFWRKGWRYRRNYSSLPGKPDFVFIKARVVVFVDGDFWHGWRYPLWKQKLSDYWQKKIERNRHRDRYNFRCLRRQGWKVIRIWGHEVEKDLAGAVDRVKALLETSLTQDGDTRHAADGQGDLRRRRRNA
jgi:DNA mismatch endonuclease (patch repair protein)